MIERTLFVSDDELARARRRVAEPYWKPAAERLRAEAERLLESPDGRPSFDHSWYDAEPERDFAGTYEQFHAYVGAARRLSRDMQTLSRAGLAFEDSRFTRGAGDRLQHMVTEFSTHVAHHDAGLVYGPIGANVVETCAAVLDELGNGEIAAVKDWLLTCGEAVRRSTAHWLSALSHMPYNNHLAAHRYGLLAIGLGLDRPDWVDEALTGPANFGEMLAGCTRDDGLCYESSTLYHFGTLGWLMKSAELARHCAAPGRDLYHETFANGRCLKQMIDAPLALMLPNGELPALGDCYARRAPLWETQKGTYELALAAYGDPRYAWIVARASIRDSQQGLIFGVDRPEPAEAPRSRSRIWVEHGYALLTSHSAPDYWGSDAAPSPAVGAVLAGDMSGIHHHADSLSLQVFAGGRLWTEDIEVDATGENLFSHPIQKDFNRTALAHNTVLVDEGDQRPIDRPLTFTEFKDLDACKSVTMADLNAEVNEGVRASRSVAVTADYCLDVCQVVADEERTWDWVVHPRADGPAACPHSFSPAELPRTPPYGLLRDVESCAVEADGVLLSWAQAGMRFRLAVTAGRPARLLRAVRPVRCDDPTDTREVFLYRVRARRADFAALYQLAQGQEQWHISSCQRRAAGQTRELRVSVARTGEKRQHIFMGL